MYRLARIASRNLPLGAAALALLSVGCACRAVMAAPMTLTVVPRAESGVFRDTTLVYLDGPIDAGAPDRLTKALDGVDGKIAVWLNSPGGNLFAGMQLGRTIRQRGASTHIIDYRTLLAGECFSACSLAFLGGVYRFNDNGARYGVHRASVGPTTGDGDLGQHLSVAIQSYIREMGVDARLFDLWAKAGRDEMYVLSQQEAETLGVVNNGRKPPEWSIAEFPGGAGLQGHQTTADGTGTLSFSCDNNQTVFGSAYQAAGRGERIDTRGWSHWLTIDSYAEVSLTALRLADDDAFVRSTFLLPPNLVRRARFAKRIGLRMKPPSTRSTSIRYAVDIDDRSAAVVRNFLGNCLRGQAK